MSAATSVRRASLCGLLVLAAALTGCRPARESGGRLVVTYWEKWTGFEGEAMRKTVEAFNASQERTEVRLLTTSQVDRKMLMATAGGIPPDVAGLWSNNVIPYADKNALLPLDEYAAQHGLTREQFIPAFWDLCYHRDHLWGLPSTPASLALHWNKRLFREVGLDPDRPPRTIEELDEYADRLTKRDRDGRILQAGFMPSEPGWWPWAWVYYFGGELWDSKGKITATSDENLRAYQWVRAYADKMDVKQLQVFSSGFGNFSSPQNPFISGIVAMELQGVWMHNFVAELAPGMEWGAAPFPYPADRPDLANSSPVEEDVLVIPRGAKHPDEAFDFIAFVNSRRGSELLNMGQRKFTPLLDVSQPFLRDHPNPYIKVFIDLAKSKNAFVPPQMPLWQEYQAEMQTAFDQIWLAEKAPKDALRDVQTRMQAKLDRDLKRYERMGMPYGESGHE
ncbi:MAG: ABC transporter substrate-binding protein [Armatimonadetes bacterium]|nr:ABC transporter substrate-binding protein [Armatimonadota bacterium]